MLKTLRGCNHFLRRIDNNHLCTVGYIESLELDRRQDLGTLYPTVYTRENCRSHTYYITAIHSVVGDVCTRDSHHRVQVNGLLQNQRQF